MRIKASYEPFREYETLLKWKILHQIWGAMSTTRGQYFGICLVNRQNVPQSSIKRFRVTRWRIQVEYFIESSLKYAMRKES